MNKEQQSAGAAVPLSDEQIEQEWDAQWGYHGREPCKLGHVAFARAVIAKFCEINAVPPASPQAGEVERLRAECDQITDLNHAQWLALGKAALLVAACNRLSEEAEEYDFDDGLGRGVQQAYWDEFEQALEHAIEAMDEANKTTARLHANPAQAGEVNEWKEAVLEQLAAHSMDAPPAPQSTEAELRARIAELEAQVSDRDEAELHMTLRIVRLEAVCREAEGALNDEQRIGWCVWRIKDLEGQLTAARAAAPQQPQAQPESAGDSVDAAPIIAAYQITEGINGIKVERVQQIKGPAKWAVRCNGNVLSVQGEWDWEPMPSSRDDDWLEKFRFDNAQDAIDAAMFAQKGGAA